MGVTGGFLVDIADIVRIREGYFSWSWLFPNPYSCNCIVWTLDCQILFKQIKEFFYHAWSVVNHLKERSLSFFRLILPSSVQRRVADYCLFMTLSNPRPLSGGHPIIRVTVR
jgi:hypothetical protein